jgi:hypothetical protein
MQSAGALKPCDGLGMHLYTGGPPEASSPAIVYCQSFAQSQSKGGKLLVTEWGYSTTTLDPGANGLSDFARRRQACYQIRMALLSWWHGLAGLTFYDLRNDGTEPGNREHNFGLYDSQGNEKPSATALRVLSQAAKGRTLVGMVSDANLPPWIHIACLQNASSFLYILWSESTINSNKITIQLSKTRVSDLFGKEIAGNTQTGSLPIDLNADTGLIYIETSSSQAPTNWTIQVQLGSSH